MATPIARMDLVRKHYESAQVVASRIHHMMCEQYNGFSHITRSFTELGIKDTSAGYIKAIIECLKGKGWIATQTGEQLLSICGDPQTNQQLLKIRVDQVIEKLNDKLSRSFTQANIVIQIQFSELGIHPLDLDLIREIEKCYSSDAAGWSVKRIKIDISEINGFSFGPPED